MGPLDLSIILFNFWFLQSERIGIPWPQATMGPTFGQVPKEEMGCLTPMVAVRRANMEERTAKATLESEGD